MTSAAFLTSLDKWSPIFNAVRMLASTGILALAITATWWVAAREARLEAVELGLTKHSSDIRDLTMSLANLASATASNSTTISERSSIREQQIKDIYAQIDRIRDRVYSSTQNYIPK